MIGYHLSKTGLAGKPFPVSHIGIGLWSVEELCFYIIHNPALADDTLLNTSLTRWLSEEFNLTDVALSMERQIRAQGKIADIVLPLLRGTGYLDAQEIRRFTSVLDRMNAGGVPVRLKMKADALSGNRRYGEAVACYEQAAELAPGADAAFRASVHHNRGAALMQMLLYEEGYAAFREAYLLEKTVQRKRCCLLAAALARPSSSFLSEAEFLEADADLVRETEAILRSAQALPLTVPEDLMKEMDRIRMEYHKEAGA